MEDLTGRQFGPYQIVAPLGEGGMAAVYKAYQPAVERYVALKVLPRHFANNPQFTSRFQREARFLAQLQHPHILPVFDYGQAEGYSYIVMPFVQSGTLTDLLTGRPLPLSRIRQVISQVGDALHYAHGRGLIHRDVKPSNILIDESGNCLLTDFGLARMVESTVNLTNAGSILGTPAYMSPEQGAGLKIDARSDLYSLGVILYEMATGRVPYRAETPIAIIYKHIQDPLPPARTVNAGVPEALELAIQKALAKSPEDRYQTAGEMVRAVDAAIPSPDATATIIEPRGQYEAAIPDTKAAATGHQSAETPIRPSVEKPRQARRWVWGVVGLAIVGLALVYGLFAVLNNGRNADNQAPTIPAVPPPSEPTQTPQPASLPTEELIAEQLPTPTATTPPSEPLQSPQPTNSPIPELASEWQAIGGSWTGPDENGTVYGTSASFDGDALYLFKDTYSDFTFSAAAQALTREASLAIRMSDDGKNGYLVIFIPRGSQGGNPGLWLAKRIEGNHTFPAFFAADYPIGELVPLTVEARGPRITVSLNGEQVIDFEDGDNPFISGRLGFRCFGEAAAPCEARFSELYLAH